MSGIDALQPLLDELRVEVFEHLPASLHYHNFDHTQTVMQNALELATAATLNPRQTLILYAAAMLHDTGYGKKYGANEGIAALLADKLLPKYHFSKSEIKQVHNMILATNQRVHPQDYLEMMLVDADMGYLAKKEYFLWSNRLLIEWQEHGLFLGSKTEWLKNQISFLGNYSYITAEAKTLYTAGLTSNLNQLKELTEWPF
jgi:predicted metal-dependent HD superfamily phosphohydrolase